MNRKITLQTYKTEFGQDACAVYNPTQYWQTFAPRFSDSRECQIMGQTPLERLSECIRARFPDVEIEVV